MEAPPLSIAPPIPPTITTPAVYPASVDSSPRSRQNDSWDGDAQPFRPSPKLRLMCSYGGHIVPRPHDKTLCYVGGDTRIIVIDRDISLSNLHRRLSKNLLDNQPFSLKYQLPSEELDSLISITADEDLENMVEEYDRLSNAVGGAKPGRLRLFLFPRSSSSIEQLLLETASTKSEDWFFDALNGKGSTLSSDRGFSDTSSINCLLGLDDEFAGKVEKDVEARKQGAKTGANGSGNVNGNHNVVNHEANSIPDSPMLDTSSSFGSTSSSPSVPNLPPIRVHVEENPRARGLGIEGQFQQMSVGFTETVSLPPPQQKQEGGGGLTATATVVPGLPVVVGGEYTGNRVFSDDERSDHGGYRKVQQIQQQLQPQLQTQQIPQFQQKQTNDIDTSPHSVSSEGSMNNPLSRQRQPIYQEQIIQIQSGNQANSKVQTQPQIQESNYILPNQYDQNHQPQQFLHPSNHYIPAGAMQIPSYYPPYPSPQQQPVYYISSKQNQPYNLPNYNELPTNQQRNAPQLVQMPSGQYGYTQIHHPSQSMAPPASSAGNSNYTYEFSDPAHAQMYYRPLQP